MKVGSKPAQGAAAPNGTIWIPNFNDNTISMIDPKTNEVVATIKTGKGPFVVRSGFRDMWVGSYQARDLWRIRP